MPFYEYRPGSTRFCPYCEKGFDLLQKIRDAALTSCPQCGNPISRIISAPLLGKSGPSLDRQNLEKHGFTQYRKAAKGVYEKTAGTGPPVISDD